MSELLAQLQAPLDAAAGVDPARPDEARTKLERAFPVKGAQSLALKSALVSAVKAGTLCERGEEPMKFSRLAKPVNGPHGFSVDVVWMSGAGPRHRHPKGEINLCYAIEGDPRFDGHPEGWVVFPPGSEHVPTVSGGRMLIVYALPEGAMEWVKDAG